MGYEGKALTIGVSDPKSGSGIDTDLKTFFSFDVYGFSIAESLMFRDNSGKEYLHKVPTKVVNSQFDSIMKDIRIDALKVSNVSGEDVMENIKKGVKKYKVDKLVLDTSLIGLLPESFIVILDIGDAEMINDISIEDQDDAEFAAEMIHEKGPDYVFLKSSEIGEKSADILFDGDTCYHYDGYDTSRQNKQESDRTFATGLTACLSKGIDIRIGINISLDYTKRAITYSVDNLGIGKKCLDHNIEPLQASAFEEEAPDFDSWFENNKTVFESELKAEKKFIDDPQKAVSIGVGSGLFASRLGIKYGVEPARGMAELAREKNIEVMRGKAEEVPLPNGEFDTVLMSTILSYVDDPQKAVDEAYRILKSGGNLIVSFLAKEGSYAMMYDLARLRGKHDLDIAPECPYPIEFISGSQWLSTEQVTNLMEEAGFDDLKYVQTLTKHPKFTDEEVEETVKGYKHGDYVVVRGKKQ